MADYVDTRGLIDEQRQLTGDFITIRLVGGKESFTVHKNMIVRRSKYFQGQIMIHPQKTVFDLALQDSTEQTLHHYILYLYSGSIQCQDLGEDAESEASDCQIRLVDFYALANQLDDTRAMDAAVSGMIASVDEGDLPNTDTVKRAYAVTKPGSPLRKLMMDTHVWCGHEAIVSDKDSKAFLLDVAKAALARVTKLGGDNWDDNIADTSCCDYYQHPKDKPCLSKKRKRDDDDESKSEEEEDESESGELKEGTPAAKKFKALQTQVKELQEQPRSLGKDK